MEATYITLLCHIICNVIFSVIVSFITKTTNTEQLWRLIYVILPPKCIELPQNSMVKIFLRNDSYFTTSL